MTTGEQINRTSTSELSGNFPWKKSVRWAADLVEVREYEKPFRKAHMESFLTALGNHCEYWETSRVPITDTQEGNYVALR